MLYFCFDRFDSDTNNMTQHHQQHGYKDTGHGVNSDLSQWLVQLLQDALLIEHLALITVLVVVVDPLTHVGRELVEGHVLLHLFIL